MGNKAKTPSFLPLLLFGLGVIFLYQLWKEDSATPPPKEVVNNATPSPQEFLRQSENFIFAKTEKSNLTNIDSESFLVQLDERGGKIAKLYIKDSERIRLPEKAIAKHGDSFAIDQDALEITQGWGIDFQPHLYWKNNTIDNFATPHLNQGKFQRIFFKKFDTLGVEQITYQINLRFKGHSLRLTKYYYFFLKEHFFRQITLLENRTAKDFTLEYFDENKNKKYGNLYFKTFSDLGPAGSGSGRLANRSNGKFFYYNSDLINRADVYSSGGFGCMPFYCTSPDQEGEYSIYLTSPNTLDFAGSRSRYFFAYGEFLTPQNIALHRPDGFIYRNSIDTKNGEAQTSVFLNFALTGRQSDVNIKGLQIQDKSPENAFFEWNETIRTLQKARRDLLIIDQEIYVGARTTSSHAFADPAKMHRAFNITGINENAEQIIYSGLSSFFSSINSAILYIMKLFYNLTGNYGWSIVMIAVFIKLLTFPLNQMQTKNIKKMSDIKPEIDRINKKYKDNAMEKQKKMMEIYKKHNINPARGCLPILIQMPIFFSLYTVFSESIELWNSPFILWMKDLSSPDTIYTIPNIDLPLNILPILMAGTQLLQQKNMSAPTNPQQKVLMNVMPFIMIILFWTIPSGVTLYWTMQNLMSIIWQEITNRKSN